MAKVDSAAQKFFDLAHEYFAARLAFGKARDQMVNDPRDFVALWVELESRCKKPDLHWNDPVSADWLENVKFCKCRLPDKESRRLERLKKNWLRCSSKMHKLQERCDEAFLEWKNLEESCD